MNVIKRSGKEDIFDFEKLLTSIEKAEGGATSAALFAASTIVKECEELNRQITAAELHKMVQRTLIDGHMYDAAEAYISHRYKEELARKENTTDRSVLSLIEHDNEEVKQENSNKNPLVVSVQRDYMAGEVSKDLTKRFLIPADIWEAHEKGIIHFHDSDYFAQHMHNCCLVNLEDMLQNGTVISGTRIDPPKSFYTACNIATQIIAQVASCQYGGQSISLSHLAPFVDVSRQKIRKQVEEEYGEIAGPEGTRDEAINKIVEKRVREEIKHGVQTIQYQVTTLMTTNGQAPFITVFMYLGEVQDPQTKADLALVIEEVLKQRYQGVKNEKGAYITPAFPKLIYVLEPDNVYEGSKYFYLTKLAAKCTSKRMVPDYISEKKMLELKKDKWGNGNCYTCMGCRSFLTPWRGEYDPAHALNYDPDKPKYYGRFNQGVVTLNLPHVALSSKRNMPLFWRILDERLDLCYRALRCRHERLLGTPSDVAPILWQHGALARLEKGETIDKLLYGGYSTISLGYAGLYECVYYLTGKRLTDPEGEKLGLQIMQRLNDACSEWKAKDDIDFSLYGTPIESTTYKFAKALQQQFGQIPGVSDKNYITNSYHIHVTQEIDAFSKLAFESTFQHLSPGGAISYVEVPNVEKNLPVVLSLMQHIYENIIYAELNIKSDYCQICGTSTDMEIVKDEHGKLIWRCPECGNTDSSKMNIARRTCGYIGTQGFNQGRLAEIAQRVVHL